MVSSVFFPTVVGVVPIDDVLGAGLRLDHHGRPLDTTVPVSTVPIATVPIATVPIATVPVATVPVSSVPVLLNLSAEVLNRALPLVAGLLATV